MASSDMCAPIVLSKDVVTPILRLNASLNRKDITKTVINRGQVHHLDHLLDCSSYHNTYGGLCNYNHLNNHGIDNNQNSVYTLPKSVDHEIHSVTGHNSTTTQ